jgi:hypothetical protein
LRRNTSALTRAALVAVVAVSTVNAQQSGPAGALPVDQFASSNSKVEGTSVRKSVGDPVYGMSSTRGARYLLRNGLDYLNYGEYQRALKFLRETESRKDELNNAEKVVLQQSIERAQRGLREATDAESPYALSDQARNRNGFNPAKPDTRIASQNNRPRVPVRRKPMFNESSAPRSTVSDSEDQGEPIRLARGDDVLADTNPNNPVAPKSSRTDKENFTDYHESNRPRQFPEIPELPRPSQELGDTATQPPNAVGPARAPLLEATRNENIIQTVAHPETRFPPAATAVVSDDSTALAHTETDDTAPVEMRKRPVRNSPTLAPPSLSTPVARQEADDLATVRTGQGVETELVEHANQTMPSSTAATPVTNNSPVGTDELPPLPTDITESAMPPHAVVNSVSKATRATDLLATAPAVNDDLPPLVANLGHPTTQSVDAVASSPARYAVQGLTPTSSSPTQDPSTAKPDVFPELSPRGVGPADAEPTLPPQVNDATVARPQSAEALPSLTQSNTVSQNVATQLDSPLGIDESTGLPLSSPHVEPNSMPAQEMAARVSLSNDASDALPPPPLAIETSNSLSSRIDSIVPIRPSLPSTLRPELKREVETIARKQEDELLRRQQAQPPAPARDTVISDLRAQTQLDISRAPSPAEARPIKAIPVPEDWVPLAPRTWSAQRKYWAAAATCHLPLYFQDPVLERYGHSVEQFVGPIGRYLTYPLDSPTQSTQRNQILQPFFSAGLFAFQIAALPYNAIVDPPWEAQYDLGYYRPGDVIPTDTYWLPLHGYGPPLHGSNY